MKIDLTELRNRGEYISETAHPTLPLLIWNYTAAAQYGKRWDEYTMMCRGLITDLEGNIVKRPFRKFFNYGQESTIAFRLPDTNPIIYPKFDGSLGILYFDGKMPYIATRGSFTSDQAKWATDWIQRNYPPQEDFKENKTYLFEIIYTENRIVVDYKGLEELVLIGVIDTETGNESPFEMEVEGERLGLSYSKHRIYTDLGKIITEATALGSNEEGYVLHWPLDGNVRVKIKGDEYVRLHRILTQTSSKTLWEMLRDGKEVNEVIERVPDEFYNWVNKTIESLVKEYMHIKDVAAYDLALMKNTLTQEYDRKTAAEWIKKKAYPAIMFKMLDGKDPKELIWKMIKPKYEKPFKNEIDG